MQPNPENVDESFLSAIGNSGQRKYVRVREQKLDRSFRCDIAMESGGPGNTKSFVATARCKTTPMRDGNDGRMVAS